MENQERVSVKLDPYDLSYEDVVMKLCLLVLSNDLEQLNIHNQRDVHKAVS